MTKRNQKTEAAVGSLAAARTLEGLFFRAKKGLSINDETVKMTVNAIIKNAAFLAGMSVKELEAIAIAELKQIIAEGDKQRCPLCGEVAHVGGATPANCAGHPRHQIRRIK